jgi:hypothetical protein
VKAKVRALVHAILWSERIFIYAQWSKEEPPAYYARGSATFFVWVLIAPNVGGKELLCLTEDTVDLGTADWADALCHATT